MPHEVADQLPFFFSLYFSLPPPSKVGCPAWSPLCSYCKIPLLFSSSFGNERRLDPLSLGHGPFFRDSRGILLIKTPHPLRFEGEGVPPFFNMAFSPLFAPAIFVAVLFLPGICLRPLLSSTVNADSRLSPVFLPSLTRFPTEPLFPLADGILI